MSGDMWGGHNSGDNNVTLELVIKDNDYTLLNGNFNVRVSNNTDGDLMEDSVLFDEGEATISFTMVTGVYNDVSVEVESPSETWVETGTFSAYVILPAVEKPTWVGNVIHWEGLDEPVDEYFVKLYKDGSYISTDIPSGEFSHDYTSRLSSEGAGTYTATVIAKLFINPMMLDGPESEQTDGNVVDTVADNAAIDAAKSLLDTTGMLNPVEEQDENVVVMAQALVDADPGASGVIVSISDASGNANVGGDGTITYTASEVTGNIVFALNTGFGTEQTSTMSVIVPATVGPTYTLTIEGAHISSTHEGEIPSGTEVTITVRTYATDWAAQGQQISLFEVNDADRLDQLVVGDATTNLGVTVTENNYSFTLSEDTNVLAKIQLGQSLKPWWIGEVIYYSDSSSLPDLSSYELIIYKDGSYLETHQRPSAASAFNPADTFYVNGSGSYTVTVQAIGDGYFDDGLVSELSNAYVVE